MAHSTTSKRSSRIDDLKARSEIVKAVESLDLTDTGAWNQLDQLATHVSVEGLEVDPESIVFLGHGPRKPFEGALNIYLELRYGANDDEGFTNGTSFWGLFKGHFERGSPKVDEVTVDTSPFYQ